ncbi:homoprotocatechuate degradation operon regulator HpaR [Afifella pfennigii]|uniref:homoprotocatechuate degradation operon regulator HpaR n=1 Tax=Afifella pfennigii TaxID=209897 RepID=UPI000A0529BC|nr:homoprotocatechuate degradation operon regulator HpaR [Afifella pfennigii]
MTLPQTERALPIVLTRAREVFMVHMRPVIAEHGCTEQQWRVLRILHETGPHDATALSAKACLLTPSTTRILKALEERCLITRKPDGKDNRRLAISISPAGKELIASATPPIAEIYQRIETAFGRDRMELLIDMLQELGDLDTGLAAPSVNASAQPAV